AHQSCEGHMTVPLPPGLKPGTKVSHYRIEKLIARGGMGLVYLATDLRLERRVALKMLSPELSDDASFRDRFMRESRLAAAVDHPNIIPIHEAGDWNGLLFIAMRYVEGVDLHTALAVSGPPETATAISLLAQAADALDAAHQGGLVHRDVKPGNLLLAGASADRIPTTAHVYLTDFGLTKRVTSVSHLTRSGQFLGVPALCRAGADPRRGRRSAHRPVRAGPCGVRAAHRPTALPA
ncbi:MAG: serine/threonine-protein kinase, partial [Nocardioidaceae bacterium]